MITFMLIIQNFNYILLRTTLKANLKLHGTPKEKTYKKGKKM